MGRNYDTIIGLGMTTAFVILLSILKICGYVHWPWIGIIMCIPTYIVISGIIILVAMIIDKWGR
jgi:hypothetical protein